MAGNLPDMYVLSLKALYYECTLQLILSNTWQVYTIKNEPLTL